MFRSGDHHIRESDGFVTFCIYKVIDMIYIYRGPHSDGIRRTPLECHLCDPLYIHITRLRVALLPASTSL